MRWGTVFDDDNMDAAVIGRIAHHGLRLPFRGESNCGKPAFMKQLPGGGPGAPPRTGEGDENDPENRPF